LEVSILTEEEIKPLLKMDEVLAAVEQAFVEKSNGRTQMPAKSYIIFKSHYGDFRTMPAYLEDSDVAGVKIVNVHPRNPRKYNLPTVMATIVLLNPRNGAPECIMDGASITAMRTGAAGGIAVKYLARRASSSVGIIGAGAQAETQLLAVREVLPSLNEVKIADKFIGRSREYARKMRKRIELSITPVKEVKDAVIDSDVVVTVTPSNSPVVKSSWVDEGVHINAIGADAPGKQELDPEILKRGKIIVDDVEQATHSGEINLSISNGFLNVGDIYAEIGDIITGKKKGRTSDSDITIFDSTGLAIQDVATAWTIYKKVKKAEKWLSYEFND